MVIATSKYKVMTNVDGSQLTIGNISYGAGTITEINSDGWDNINPPPSGIRARRQAFLGGMAAGGLGGLFSGMSDWLQLQAQFEQQSKLQQNNIDLQKFLAEGGWGNKLQMQGNDFAQQLKMWGLSSQLQQQMQQNEFGQSKDMAKLGSDLKLRNAGLLSAQNAKSGKQNQFYEEKMVPELSDVTRIKTPEKQEQDGTDEHEEEESASAPEGSATASTSQTNSLVGNEPVRDRKKYQAPQPPGAVDDPSVVKLDKRPSDTDA